MSDARPHLTTGTFRFSGYLGSRIDTVASGRLTDPLVRERVYPEVEEAFRERIDDQLQPGVGKWQGEFWGKWVLGLVAAYQYYGDDSLLEFIRRAARGLIGTQDDNGYIGTYTDSTYVEPGTWNVWCRKYVLWGLLECYDITDDEEILEATVRFADHLISEVGPGARDIVRTGQFNGLPSTSILTPMVMLYRATGEQRFLDYGRYIVDQWSGHPDGPPDILRKGLSGEPVHTWFPHPQRWAKSYEFISCVEGLVDLYDETGTEDYLTAARNIHRQLAQWERSPVGSVSFNDMLVGSRFLRNVVAEICDVVYWNRLSLKLLLNTGEARYADEIERSLYNSLLVGSNREGTWGLRRLRLTHEHIKAQRHCSLEHHHCCVDNLPRGLFQASETAFLADDEGVRLALLNPGEGSVVLSDGRRIGIAIGGDYPYSGGDVSITVTPNEPTAFTLRIRLPGWVEGAEVRVDGEPVTPDAGGWVTLQRHWEPGKTVTLVIPMGPRTEWFEPRTAEPGEDGPSPELIRWHEDEWVKLGFMREGVGQESSLEETDVQPHERAGLLFRGPVLLGLDRRVTGTSPFPPQTAPVSTAAVSGEGAGAQLSAVADEAGPAYELRTADGRMLRLLPFDRLGATWDRSSEFNSWTVQ